MIGLIDLCSASTPDAYLKHLSERHVGRIIAVEDHVDMRAALEELAARYGVEKMRGDVVWLRHEVVG